MFYLLFEDFCIDHKIALVSMHESIFQKALQHGKTHGG